MKINDILEHLVLIGLVGALFIPRIDVGLGINLITPVSLLLLFYCIFHFAKYRLRLDGFIVIYIGILISIFVSINHGYISLNLEESYRDYMEFFRYFQFLPYLAVGALLNIDSFEKKFTRYILVAGSAVIVVAVFQVTNFFNLGYFFGSLYAHENHVAAMFTSSERIVATGGNPNTGAAIVSFLLGAIYFTRYSNLVRMLFCSALLLIILLTQSRTGIIAIALSLSTYFIFLSEVNIFIKIIVGILVVYILIMVFSFLQLEYVIIGLETAFYGNNPSLNVRFENINLAVERWSDSWIFGQGPAKAVFSTTVDSEYGLILQRYGGFGFLLFGLFLLCTFKYSFRLLDIGFTRKFNAPLIGICFSWIGMVVMLTNNYFSGYQTGAIPILIAIVLILLNRRSAETYPRVVK